MGFVPYFVFEKTLFCVESVTFEKPSPASSPKRLCCITQKDISCHIRESKLVRGQAAGRGSFRPACAKRFGEGRAGSFYQVNPRASTSSRYYFE
jgi:hypothetical protein